jgi:hypothetical protein
MMRSLEPRGARRPTGHRRNGLGIMAAALLTLALLASACVNQGAWTTTSVTSRVGADPHFESVSCPTTTFCMAVGTAYPSRPVLQVWNGTTWSPLAFPFAGAHGADLIETACASPTSCLVTYVTYDILDQYELVAHWDGTTWAGLNGSFGERKHHLGCAPDDYCLTVRDWFAHSWDQGAQRTEPGPDQLDANAVACTAGRRCLAVGSWYSQTWDGTSHTWGPEVSYPIPDGARFETTSVSCTSALQCVAVGALFDGTARHPAAARWDGTAWTFTAVPITTEGTLTSVSCASAIECVAVGTTSTPPAAPHGVALTWNAVAWQATGAPNDEPAMQPTSISCPAAGVSCMAVGWRSRARGDVLRATLYSWTR